ncbi:polysaccharide biosynthesis protein [Streptomyces sp. WMMC500]|uniref:polysaccharide biosynthesis protein n=1 Tax=Streptomyces sp. WMMC500 TaxID=3015154 RepID=UPI00248B97A9|nr:polysaccharide biosynthesis protein [Streptomyces sp. WMMC500]WBB61730.1 polysaccharide biosynthesis protein [Streptomyces sp. WMMC500]
MSDDTIRLATVGRIIRRRLRLLAVVAVAGALAGYGASVVFPPRYTTSASVLLPGSWEERELLTQAEIATSSVVVDRAAEALGWSGVGGTELRDRVRAGTADGSIIRISGTAETPERAQRLADQVAEEYVAFAARVVGDSTDPEAAAQTEALRDLVEQTGRRISALADAADPGRTVESVQARTELEKLRASMEEAMDKLDRTDSATSRADMVVMGPAARPAGQAPPTRTHLILAGALSFVLGTVVGHLAAARMSRRPRSGPEIASALGAALLGTVDVPEGQAARRVRGGGPRARLRRLLGVDTRWDLPTLQASGDEASRRTRYRRVWTRLRDRLPAAGRLLVVVPDDDEVARRAAELLAAEAGGDPSANSSSGGHPALRVEVVPVSHPLVPDRGTEDGALVVLGAGRWSAGEIAGLGEACADAGHEVVGAVVAGTVRGRPPRSAGDHAADVTPAVAVGADAGGGSA